MWIDTIPSIELRVAEIKYPEARGWRQAGPNAWESPRRDGILCLQDHALSCQKEADHSLRRRVGGVCGWKVGHSQSYVVCTLLKGHEGDHQFGKRVHFG